MPYGYGVLIGAGEAEVLNGGCSFVCFAMPKGRS